MSHRLIDTVSGETRRPSRARDTLRPRRRLALARLACGLAALLGAAPGCATNPVTGRSEIVLMSEAREAELGAQAAEQVAASIGLVEDEALTAYVRALGERLAQRSPRRGVRYRFFVADMPEPNAFALPGGYIYISRGLLALSNSEAELANVIGHEIGHVAARHAAQRETRALGANLLTVLGVLAAGASGNTALAQATSEFGQIAAAGLIASYGREQEHEADAVGQRIAAGSGWDPAAMASFLDQLRGETRLRTGGERLPSFLDSHPATADRVRVTAERAAGLPVAPTPAIAASRAAFYGRLRGLLIGPNPREGVFRGPLFLHAPLDLALRFPEGWRTQNQKQAVAAQSPERDAVLVLEAQGPSGDPAAAAAEFAERAQLALGDGERLRGSAFPSYRARARARTESRELALSITWIAHPKVMLRLTGAVAPERWSAALPHFEHAAASIRTLRAAERESIRAQRLAVATARAGESLDRLSRRVGNRWSVDETAVANDLEKTAPLKAGRPVKVVVDAEVVE